MSPSSTRLSPSRRIFALTLAVSQTLLALALTGCKPVPKVSLASGNGQIGAPGTLLAQPLVVTVNDPHGNLASGVHVTFSVLAGGGRLSNTSATTDVTGQASTTLTLGPTPGTNTVTASVTPALGSPVTFTATALGAGGASVTLVDDFESAASPSPWRLSTDAGAQGSLTSGPGHTGKGAHLAFDFHNGGRFVSLGRDLAPALAGEEIAFWVSSPPGIRIWVRATDATGQQLQYALSRPLEAIDGNAWYRHVVELDAPSSYQGGASDGRVHGAIGHVEILAADPVEGGTSGAVDVDDVSVIDQTTLDLDPRATALAPAPAGTTSLAGDLGVEIHFLQDDKALDAAKGAGFSCVRMDLAWDWIETTPGVYDFSAFDGLLASLDARGMKAVFILDYGNKLHEDGPGYSPQSAATVTAFGNYVEAAGRHFAGRGVRYEIWNEPNLPIYWKPFQNAGQYAALCREAIARLHQGDPQAQVTLGGLSGFDFPFLRSVLQSGAGAGAAAAGVHPYRNGSPETASDELLLMRSLVSQAIPGATVWDTEWGYDGANFKSDQLHAKTVVRELLSCRALGLPLAVYYEIRDDSSGRFGLLDATYGDKPAIVAVRTLSRASAGRTFAGFLQGGPTSFHALRLDGASDHVLVLWSDASRGSVAVTVPAGSTATDFLGAPLALTPINGRLAVTVSEAAGPVFVTTP